MKVTRRKFMMTTAATMLAAGRGFAENAGLAILILEDIPNAWDTDDTTEVLAHFLRTKLPFCLNRSLGQSRVDGTNYALSPFYNAPGTQDILEVVPTLPLVNKSNRLSHLRAAYDMREWVLAAWPHRASDKDWAFPITYFEQFEGSASDLIAFRSAGFRIRILRLEATSPVEITQTGLDQLSIAGGTLLDLFDPDLEAALAGATPNGANEMVLHLSLSRGAGMDAEELACKTESAVGLISAMLRRTGYLALLPRHLFLMNGPPLTHDIALLLGAAEGEVAMDTFAKTLKDNNLPFSRIASRLDDRGDCAANPDSETARLADCVVAMDGTLAADSPATVFLGAGAGNGLTADIRMRFGLLEAEAAAKLDELTVAQSDRVLFLELKDVAEPPQRARLLRWFQTGQNAGTVRLHDVEGLRDRVLATDPVIRRYWSLRRRRVTDPPRSTPPDPAERARLMEDASLAWRYFERYTYPETGLAAGTVFSGPAGRINSEITLWDAGSQINATIAAAALGLITQSVAGRALRKLMSSVPVSASGPFRLPPSNFSARTLTTLVAGFDSCDAGRLGIALARAVDQGLMDKDEVQTILDGWTLEPAVQDGRLFTNRDGRWRDMTQSHCTDYAAHGFAFFGQEVEKLLNSTNRGAEADVMTLYAAAAVGAISTEPFALDMIEVGQSHAARLMLDAIFDAQLSWFEQTGKMRCISEAPINRAPWFIYSGLRIDLEGPDAWVIGTILRDEAFSTDKFRQSNDLISSKAAYLWKALYPHSFTDRLVDIIRDKAAIPGVGFSVGVFAATQEPMENYSDINTNGIILSAIAHILAEP